MSQKTNPKILQIRETKDWLSRGFYQGNFPNYLEEDFVIREFLEKKLKQALIEDIEIERTSTALKIIIKTARPALVIGRGGKGVEELKLGLAKELTKIKKKQTKKAASIEEGKPKQDVKIEILEIKNPWHSAKLVSQWIASQIEKMVPYRRVLKMALAKVREQKDIKGVRVSVAGRLNGIEISRTEWLGEGQMPRQTIRSVIDYGFSQAYCTYGVIGVKVWLYKGEKFE